MKHIVLAVTVLAALAAGLEYQKSLGIPDTWPLFGQSGTGFMNPVTGRIYFSEWGHDVQVVDPATGQRFSHFPGGYSRALHCPETGRIWFIPWLVWDRRDMFGVDDRTDTVVTTVFYPRCYGRGAPAYSPTSGKFYAGEGNYVFDARTGELLDSVGPYESCDRTWDPQRDLVYQVCWGGLRILDCRADTLLDTVIGGLNEATALFLHPDGRRLYCVGTAGDRSRAVIVDVELLAVVDTVDLPRLSDDEEHIRLLYREGEDCLYAFGQSDNTDTTAVISCRGDSLLRPLVLGDVSGGLENRTDRRFYLSRYAYPTGSVAVLESPDSVSRFIAPGAVGLAWSPQTNRLCVPVDDTVYLFDAATESLVGSISYWKMFPQSLTWTGAGGKLYAFADSSLETRIAAFSPLDSLLALHTVARCTRPAYSPGRDRLYFGSGSSLRVYDCAVDSFVFDRPLPAAAAAPVAVEDLGRLYVPCGLTTEVYDLATDSVAGTVAGLDGPGWQLAGWCAPAHRLFVAMTGDTRIAVVDTDTDSLIRYAPCEPVIDFAVSTTSPEAYALVQRRVAPQRIYLLTLDAVSGEVVRSLQLPRLVTDINWVAEHDRVYMRAQGSGQVQVDIYDCRAQTITGSTLLPVRLTAHRPLYDPRRRRLWYRDNGSIAVFQCGVDSVVDVTSLDDFALLAMDEARERLFGVADWRIEVYGNAPPAVTQQREAELHASATVLNGVLALPASSALHGASNVLLDVTGRKVLDLKPGDNDVSRLAPGVYFVRQSAAETGMPGGKRQESSVTRVVLVR